MDCTLCWSSLCIERLYVRRGPSPWRIQSRMHGGRAFQQNTFPHFGHKVHSLMHKPLTFIPDAFRSWTFRCRAFIMALNDNALGKRSGQGRGSGRWVNACNTLHKQLSGRTLLQALAQRAPQIHNGVRFEDVRTGNLAEGGSDGHWPHMHA